MKIKVFILIASVDSDIDRKEIERVEGTHYKIKSKAHHLEREVYDLAKKDIGKTNFNVFELADFTTLVNDQELDNLTDSFIAYVTAETIE